VVQYCKITNFWFSGKCVYSISIVFLPLFSGFLPLVTIHITYYLILKAGDFYACAFFACTLFAVHNKAWISNLQASGRLLYKYYVSGHHPSSCPLYISERNVSETGFFLRLQVNYTQLGTIDRTSPCLRGLSPTGYILPKNGDRIQSANVVFLNKNRAMDNVQKRNICINVS
jgi:hypothetical protein